MIFSRKTIILQLILVSLCALLSVGELSARSRRGAKSKGVDTYKEITREEYIDRYKHIAIAHQRRYGIPASITMAQGILESNSGNSTLARRSNNHFGIKCKSDWRGRSVTHDDDAPNECFRAYDTVEASYEDHAEFLDSSPRYDSLFLFSPTDYRSWARGLKGAGYATAHDYAPRLVKLIEDNKLYLLDGESGDYAYIASQSSLPTERVEQRVAEDEAKIDPNNFRIAVNSVGGYNIYKTNRVMYIVAKAGDSYRDIARVFDLSPSALRKFNDLDKSASVLKGGEPLYIERKGTAWSGNTREHRVQRGESIYSIAQSYGVRVASLRRLNGMKSGDEVSEGVTINIR